VVLLSSERARERARERAQSGVSSALVLLSSRRARERAHPTAAHLSPISLMVLMHLLFELFLSPYRRLCAFLGRPLMAYLRKKAQ
jgi:hypothetical protein